MIEATEKQANFNARTCVRLIQLIKVLDNAGACPIDLRGLHAFVYFSNVLSPLWDLVPFNAEVLKDKKGPYYPSIQRQLDQLIACNIVKVVSFKFIEVQHDKAWLDATISIEEDAGNKILDVLECFPDEVQLWPFLEELALAFSEIEPDRQDDAALVDAAYSDPQVSDRRLVEAEAGTALNVARRFQEYAPIGIQLSRAEKLLLYMRLMKKRAHG